MLGDTIVAVSTAMGEAGIGIVRLSGIDALAITGKIFMAKDPIRFSKGKGYRLYYGNIIDPDSGLVVDEVLVSLMRTPHSFTGEDVVEINCHGGFVAQKNILALLLRYGARLADAGEFTKRAFINGRLDLAQAEAVIDLIRAKTSMGAVSALEQLKGKLSDEINRGRSMLLEVIAEIEAGIDFPEENLELDNDAALSEKLRHVLELMEGIQVNAQRGRVLRDGINTAIIGQPNVGKSSILNALLREERAIVTDIPGTTRDVLEEYISIKGIPLKLIDTAGLRETEDLIEKLGIAKAQQVLANADLVLLVLEAGRELTEGEKNLLVQIPPQRLAVIINKIDLDNIPDISTDVPVFYVSTLEKKGIEKLEDGLIELVAGKPMGTSPVISNVRHISSLENSICRVKDAIHSLGAGIPLDLVSIDVRAAWSLLGEITGDTLDEDLLNEIFSRFCIGK